jgi:hypothetical protein
VEPSLAEEKAREPIRAIVMHPLSHVKRETQ